MHGDMPGAVRRAREDEDGEGNSGRLGGSSVQKGEVPGTLRWSRSSCRDPERDCLQGEGRLSEFALIGFSFHYIMSVHQHWLRTAKKFFKDLPNNTQRAPEVWNIQSTGKTCMK